MTRKLWRSALGQETDPASRHRPEPGKSAATIDTVHRSPSDAGVEPGLGSGSPSGAADTATTDRGELAFGDSGFHPQAGRHLEAASASSGQALPGGLSSALGSSLGTDVSGVRVHTDGASATAAQSIRANAYAIGDDVHFATGMYAPETTSGQHLIAHEVAHTVQQRGAAATPQLDRIDVSEPGDAHEVEADRFADSFLRGEPAPVAVSSGAVSRKRIARDPSGPNAHVGGEEGAVTFLGNPETGTVVAPGDVGYSDQVLRGVGDAAGELANGGLYQDARIENLLPNTSIIDSQSRIRAREAAEWRDRQEAGWFGADGISPPSGAWRDRYGEYRAWCEAHAVKLASHKNAHISNFAAYNGYVPFANSFFEALLRLEGMQNILGVSSPTEMASALVTGLTEARSVAGRAREAFTAGAAGSTRALNVPEADGSVTALLGHVNQAQQEMQTAYTLFSLTRLETERMDVNAEGDAARARMAEIEQVKTFLRQVGSTIDTTSAVIGNAPSVMNRAGEMLRAGEAHVGAWRNRRAMLAGERPTHNPTYLTVNEEGEMVVRNTMTGTDRPAGGGDATPSPTTGLPSLPTSAEELLGTIADFAYGEEVRQLTTTLNAIAVRCDAIAGVERMTTLAHRARNYMDKVMAFSRQCNDLHRRMIARRQAYLDLGVELDNFARTDRESRRRGEAPGAGEERYATIFMATSAVREVLAVGREAVNGMPMNPEEVADWWWTMVQERRERPPRTDIQTFHTGDEEYARVNDMYGQLGRHRNNCSGVQTIFAEVESVAQSVMTAMTPATAGAGGPAVPGAATAARGGPGDY